jgi:aspartate-semialdehyde dehydrogenase
MPPGPGKLARVAIVGASSLRSKELKQTLEDRNFPTADIVLLDASVMAGTLTEAAGEPTFIRTLEADSFENIQFAFFSGAAIDAEQNWPAARSAGASIIDLTGALAEARQATALIPSLGLSSASHSISRTEKAGSALIYAPPAPVIITCTVATALAQFKARRVVLLLFPPASEHDQAGIEELESQTTNLLSFRPIEKPVFGAQVAFNLLAEQQGGSKPALREARNAIARDAAKLLEGHAPVPAIQLLQAPVFYGYAFAAYAEFESVPQPEQLETVFAGLGAKVAAPGEAAPNNVSVAGESEIHLARIESDQNIGAAVWLWGAADNLRLATTNAVRIAEELLGKSAE